MRSDAENQYRLSGLTIDENLLARFEEFLSTMTLVEGIEDAHARRVLAAHLAQTLRVEQAPRLCTMTDAGGTFSAVRCPLTIVSSLAMLATQFRCVVSAPDFQIWQDGKVRGHIASALVVRKMLFTLVRAAGNVVTYDDLTQAVWGQAYDPTANYFVLMSTMSRVRRILGPAMIDCVRGEGFRLVPGPKFLFIDDAPCEGVVVDSIL